MVIARYFDDDLFNAIKNDWKFLVEKIKSSGYEYDLQIRDNYFNFYYRGNSLGKIEYRKKAGHYNITVHHRFIDEKKIKNRFSYKTSEEYLIFSIRKNQLQPFFSSENLHSMGRRVKKVNYQEETTFEQMLMTDNVNRTDLIVIDRQVVDETGRTKMDLLVLEQKQGNDYQFCIIEVKLGNNPELKGAVITQLRGYIDRITTNFPDYKECYERNLSQKQELGLLDSNMKINIVPGVTGLIAVLGYSGIAKKSIGELKGKDPRIKVLSIKYKLDLTKAT